MAKGWPWTGGPAEYPWRDWGLATTFSGKLIDRAGWEIYIAEFERLARARDIPEEEKVRKLSEAVPKGWQESILWAEGKPNGWSWVACPRLPQTLKSE